MKLNRKIVFLLVIIIIIFSIFITLSLTDQNNNSQIDIPYNTKLESLKSTIMNSGYFLDSEILLDESTDKLIIDQKYIINIKNEKYIMKIKDTNDEVTYCNIVDAIEMGLGLEKGKSIKTCMYMLNGMLNFGGIDIEFFDTYKVLTINGSETLMSYDDINSHGNSDIISFDEVNYDIKINNYWFTSLLITLKEDGRQPSICGNIYNSKDNADTFTMSVYGTNRNLLAQQDYVYNGTKEKYNYFCIDFESLDEETKFYSIKLKK